MHVSSEATRSEPSEPRRNLGLLDAVCLIVGVIIGAGIYEVAPTVSRAAHSSAGIFGIWLLGGLLSLVGACCYAELATAYPRAGGDYVYLSRAYGPWAGFVFGWFQCTLIRPGDIAVIAWVFGHHFSLLIGSWWSSPQGTPTTDLLSGAAAATIAILLLTAVHFWNIHAGRWTQNMLTIAKVAGIGLLVAAAFSVPGRTAAPEKHTPSEPLTLALILVMFTYGGWSDMAFIAAEVRQPKKNILRGLVLGTLLVTAIYLVMNAAFLHALGHAAMARSQSVAQDAVAVRWPQLGGRLINALVCVSTFGALSGLILSGARISYALGHDHPAFAWLGRWNLRADAPRRALVTQGFIAVAMVIGLQGFLETLMYTSGAVYTFFTATSLAVFVLRFKEPWVERPYRVTGYPVTVIVFTAVSAYLAYSAITYKPWHAVAMAVYLVAGLVVYCLQKWWQSSRASPAAR